MVAPLQSNESHASNGARLVSADGRALPLRAAQLTADAKAGVIRVTLEQTFQNPHDQPLQVTYSLPLPADGAVSGFAFRIGERRVVGEVDTRKKARERFEDAILEGRTAALLDQERSSLFTQQLGNVPPKTTVVCELVIDQKLTWLPDGCWEWRFPTVVAPRYLGEPGRVADAAAVTVDVADAPLATRLGLALAIRDRLAEGARPHSPSHPLHAAAGIDQRFDVTFAGEGGAALDRDVVVRWKVAAAQTGTALDVARPEAGATADAAYALLTLVPPTVASAALPRDLIVLLDTSGSMSGAPLDQSRRIASALVDGLTDQDQLELIEFSNSPQRWKSHAVAASAANRSSAQQWLAKLRASGGTEMRQGIIEALRTVHPGAQRQVVLITDGLIGSEHEVLKEIAQNLPEASRVHCIGVGSAVNRSLTLPASRAGRGVEQIVGIGEDVEVALKRLLARTAQPLVTALELSGSALLEAAPRRLPDLYGGAPAMVSLKLRPEGGELWIRGRTAEGPFEAMRTVDPVRPGEGSGAAIQLFAREKVEDLELLIQTGGDARELEPQVEQLGLAFQISTRLTSWVAVSAEATVDPRAPKRRESMPQNLPHGMSAEGLGLRPAMSVAPMPSGAPPSASGLASKERSRSLPGANRASGGRAPAAPPAPAPAKAKKSGLIDRLADAFAGRKGEDAEEEAPSAEPKPGARRIKARLVLTSDGVLMVAFTVDGAPLDWKPRGRVKVELADGTALDLVIETARTTYDGTLAVGLEVTLALVTDRKLEEISRLTVASGEAALELVL